MKRQLLLIAALLLWVTARHRDVFAAPLTSSVTIVGSLQNELGCPGDWQPECANTKLSFDATDDMWQATFVVPAGSWHYKVALNDGWEENYGAHAVPNGANIPLSLGAMTAVKFYFDDKSNWVSDNVTSVIATAAGSFQSELGCSGDWQPDCLRSWLQDVDGDGIYTYTTDQLPAGSYDFKVALDEGWAVSYPANNVSFNVAAGQPVTIFYNSRNNHVSVISGAPSAITISSSSTTTASAAPAAVALLLLTVTAIGRRRMPIR